MIIVLLEEKVMRQFLKATLLKKNSFYKKTKIKFILNLFRLIMDQLNLQHIFLIIQPILVIVVALKKKILENF